jgi:hypothetical protein
MSSRYEREIEELLRRMDGRLRSEPLSVRLRRKLERVELAVYCLWRAFLRRSPIEQFMIGSVVLALLSYGLHLFSPRAAFYAGIISVVLFVLAITVSIASHRGGLGFNSERRWRGRPIDLPPASGPGAWWWRLRRWWRRRF